MQENRLVLEPLPDPLVLIKEARTKQDNEKMDKERLK